MSVNVTATGNLVADPELRFTPAGHAVANFRIACSDRKFDKASNAWVDGPTTFIAVQVWRQAAQNVADSVTKGMRVVVVGKLLQREFETANGDKRTVYELHADDVSVSLKLATATVARAGRGGASTSQSSDPWAAAPSADSEPPF